ncbi:MAG: DUF3575 domain-containing protein [Muribaculaceae bacterium]|nr:DUF3575 domain-containing protein [Muribaculaceae bacterium]
MGGNAERMADFISKVSAAGKAGNIDHISVSAVASPEGSVDRNLEISQLRCDAIMSYIMNNTGLSRVSFLTAPEGEAWDELRKLVEATPDVPMREKVLDIIDNTPVWLYDSQQNIIGGRKKELMDLAGGEPYRWIYTILFPLLRYAEATVFYSDVEDSSDLSDMPDLSAESETSKEHLQEPETAGLSGLCEPSGQPAEPIKTSAEKHFYMAAKTNMLYDAALVPNLGAEFYLGKDLSLYGDWMYAWWDRNPRHRYWRIYGGDLGLRWWFGRKAHAKPLTGHHLGIYGGILTFDFELGDTGYLGGKPGGTLWDRYLINAGVEYGYSLPVAKRLNIDFSIGLGYLGGNYIKYFPFDNDYFRQKEYKMRYFGPTKAEISLVWLIGRGNFNNRKGGDR